MARHEDRLEQLFLDSLAGALGKSIPLPETLFHYTDANGALGLLQSGCAWATHQEFLNDPSEGSHAMALALAELDRLPAYSDQLKGTLSQRLTGEFVMTGEYHVDAYIASFSNAQDELSQWRAYADNGAGFSIGIRPSETPYTQKLDSFDKGTAWMRVLYNEDEFTELVREFVRRGESLVSEAVKDGVLEQGAINRLANWFQVLTRLCQRVCKQRGYSGEQEWRLVHVRRRPSMPYDTPASEGVEYRVRAKRVCPYRSLPLSDSPPKLPLDSVWLGPASADSEQGIALRVLLTSLGYDPRSTVKRSSTLYRPT